MPLFHLAPNLLSAGSVIQPGNFGRIIRLVGPSHSHFLREMAVEQCRIAKYPGMPSRLEACFAFINYEEAVDFQQKEPGFQHSMLYPVELVDASAPTLVVDWRLCAPQALGADFPDSYWMNSRPFDGASEPWVPQVTGITDWFQATGGRVSCREVVTASPLRIGIGPT